MLFALRPLYWGIGLLQKAEATCYPGFENALEGAVFSEKYVVENGDYITARGAGVCIEFGLALVKKLRGQALADDIRAQIQCP